MMAACSTATQANHNGNTATEDDPPLTAKTSERDGLPIPFAGLDALTDQERALVAEEVRIRAHEQMSQPFEVRAQPSGIEVCVDPDVNVQPIEAALRPLFQRESDISVVDTCRLASISLQHIGQAAKALRPELTKDNSIDQERVWNAIVNAFPEACSAQIDGATMVMGDGPKRKFSSHVRLLPTSPQFQGIVIKEQLSVEVDFRGSDQLFLSVDTRLYWRRRKSSAWTEARRVDELDPNWLTMDAGSVLGRCERALAGAVLR